MAVSDNDPLCLLTGISMHNELESNPICLAHFFLYFAIVTVWEVHSKNVCPIIHIK